VGVPVPAATRDALQRALVRVGDDLGAVRRSDPLGWHLTLAFVGELADEEVPALQATVTAVVTAARLPPPELLVTGAGRFGDRVLFCAVTDRPDGTLVQLGATLQTAIDRAGLPVEQREVRPHVTVARGSRRTAVTVAMVEALGTALLECSPIRWTPQAVAVYRAVDRDGPAHYTVEGSVPLAIG
jgi:RNA 2',3'-cyclic 3'-phosphodiesterase